MSDVFALQEELAQAIVSELPLPTTRSAERKLVKPATENLEAYNLYMRGRYFANKRTPEELRVATEYFEQAIALDPASALAHSGLAGCLALRGFEEFGQLPPREAMPAAEAAALKAIELDPTVTEAHLWLGVVRMLYDWDRVEAAAEFDKATASGQNSIAYLWHAVLLASESRYEESITRIRQAQALDPLSLPVHQTVARCYAWAGEYDKALEHLRETLKMEPRHPFTYAWIGRSLIGKGSYQEAVSELEKGMEVAGRLPLLLQLTGCAYGRLGMHDEARKILSELRQLSSRRYVSPMFEAYVLGAMGELDEAFRMYDRAVEQRCGLLAFFRITHEASNPAVRADPRFAALLKKVRLDF
jgi:tetratricopeptide (TPR) repeat protein